GGWVGVGGEGVGAAGDAAAAAVGSEGAVVAGSPVEGLGDGAAQVCDGFERGVMHVVGPPSGDGSGRVGAGPLVAWGSAEVVEPPANRDCGCDRAEHEESGDGADDAFKVLLAG